MDEDEDLYNDDIQDLSNLSAEDSEQLKKKIDEQEYTSESKEADDTENENSKEEENEAGYTDPDENADYKDENEERPSADETAETQSFPAPPDDEQEAESDPDTGFDMQKWYSGESDEHNEKKEKPKDDEELSQDEKIENAKPSDKENLKDLHENKAKFLKRDKVLLCILAVLAVFCIVVFVIIPDLAPKKKQKSNELDKADSVYIPAEIDKWQPEETESNVKMEDSNSAIDKPTDEELEEKFPAPVNNNTAPVKPVKNGSGGGESSVPLTNRNEQQKQFFGVALSNPSSSQGTVATTKSSGRNGNYSRASSSVGSTYTPSALSSNMEKYMASMTGNGDSYESQNNQSDKKNFFENEEGGAGNYKWNSEYSLWKGTVIPAVLDTGINTDLPGAVMATVTSNVYSSQDGNYILIPQGSRLYATYNSSISYGQNRIQVAWETLIRPDGLEINLGNVTGVDSQGYTGYTGWKSEHPFEYAKALGLIAVFSVINTKMDNTIDTTGNTYAQNVLTDTYSETQKLNNKIVERALDIQPTLKKLNGSEVKLITNISMDLPPFQYNEE